jgi:hypothetical protein
MHPICPGQVSALHRTARQQHGIAVAGSGQASDRCLSAVVSLTSPSAHCIFLARVILPSFYDCSSLSGMAATWGYCTVSGLCRMISPSPHRRDGGEKEQRSYLQAAKYGLVLHVSPPTTAHAADCDWQSPVEQLRRAYSRHDNCDWHHPRQRHCTVRAMTHSNNNKSLCVRAFFTPGPTVYIKASMVKLLFCLE